MKIAFVTPSLTMGGYEKVVIAYANELSRRGHQVDILCGRKVGDLLNTVSPAVNILDFNARARDFVFPLIKYLKNNQVDILYCGFRSYNMIGTIAKLISRSKVCVYASQHGFQGDGKFESLLKGFIIKKADRLTAVTKTVAQFEADKMGIDPCRFNILNNPVYSDEQEIVAQPHKWLGENKDAPVIVVCGRITRDKGIPTCIQILKQINTKKNVKMIVLGDGPLLNECKQLAAKEKVDHLIDFMGYIKNPLGYMVGCDLLLHTPVQEGFGNCIVEALVVNIPVCVTDCTGPIHIIQNNKYGVNLGKVTDAGFIEKSAQTVIDVLDGKIKFDNLQERALDFEIKKSTDQFLSIL